ncbi:MerR family transcriptional regulator [Streptomyces sp. SCUT-3]|uniref:MerR family transcriptional regulator n=1 Tax=Streptomyces sp. SCUT-3 TaxID=2684469 RepID=UPI002174E432|nr:MerR family transcriptional regulator [Streptomyces sp. SCUT-3]
MAEDPEAPRSRREYRVEELAEAAGITVRTLRFYRERRLLPAPRREGRVAWYSEEHLARLKVIAALLDRGHTLGGIAELLGAWEEGRDVAELLGLEAAITTRWSDETPVRLTWDEAAETFGEQLTDEALDAAVGLGYVALDEEGATHVSRRLLDATTTLMGEGVPLTAVLDAGRHVREHVDAMAERFVELFRTHVLNLDEAKLLPGEAARLAEALERLRPVAGEVVQAELAMAMDRRIRAEIDTLLRPGPGAAPEAGPGLDPGPGPAPGQAGTGTGQAGTDPGHEPVGG